VRFGSRTAQSFWRLKRTIVGPLSQGEVVAFLFAFQGVHKKSLNALI